jgi:hypothetical protein
MEHSRHLHPEFGLLSPRPRLRRELRIAATSVLFGLIAGATCVSAVVGLRHPDSPASVEAASAPPDAGTATPRTTAEALPPASGETSAPAVAPPPPSAIAPKTRMVRVRRPVDSPAIGRIPLGRSEAPAAAPLPDDPSNAAANTAVPAGDDVAAVAPEKPVARSGAKEGAKEGLAPSPSAKKAHKTVRAAGLRRNDSGNDSLRRDERSDDWSIRAAAPADANAPFANPETAFAQSDAREGLAGPPPSKKTQRTVRKASSRRNSIENDPWLRDERQENWRARAAAVNDERNPVGRANTREAASSFRGFWDWSR